MAFLFFDIECCNGLNVCSFGYVLADENLNVIDKNDIIINPNVGKIVRQHSDVPKLAYSYTDFNRAEMFPYHYPKIVSLLTDPNNIVFGFSTCNDALFLNGATDRYNLPRVPFKFYDIQRMYGILYDYNKQIGLETLANLYQIDVGTSHKSDDDALTSCLIVKAISQELALPTSELIALEPTSYAFNTADGIVLSAEWQASRAVRLGENLKGVNYKIFTKIIAEQSTIKRTETIEGVTGKAFSFARNYEKANYKNAVILIKKIANAGGKYTTKVTHAQYFLNYDSVGERFKYASNNPNLIKIITYDDLLGLLNLTALDMEKEIIALDLTTYLDEEDKKFVIFD